MRAAFGPEGLHNVCRRIKTSNSWLVHWVLSPTHELAWIFICSISKGDHDIPSSWSCGLGEHDEIMQILLSYASVLYSDPSSHRGPVLASLGAEGPSVSAKSCQNVFTPVDSWVLVRLILLMNFQCKWASCHMACISSCLLICSGSDLQYLTSLLFWTPGASSTRHHQCWQANATCKYYPSIFRILYTHCKEFLCYIVFPILIIPTVPFVSSMK
jgi:hypothetical protein